MKTLIILNKLLFTRRLIIFSLILIALSIAFFVTTSRMLTPLDYQLFYANSLKRDYFQNAFVFLKWMTLINVMFLSTHSFIFNRFDALFLSFKSKREYVLIKICSIGLMNIVIILCLWLSFAIVSQLTNYYVLSNNDYLVLYHLIVFGNYYLTMTLFCFVIFNHVGGIFIPFIGFLLSFILTDPGIVIYDVKGFLSINHMVFPEIIYTNDGNIQFLYGFIYISILTIIYIVVNCEKVKM